MKKLLCIVSSVLCLFQLQAIEIPSFNELEQVVAFQYATIKKIAPKIDEREGFLEDSLIQTPSGYKKIQAIKVGNIICGAENNEKIVVDIFEQKASQFVRLTKNNEIIRAACHQKFYLSQQDRWISAQDITTSDIVLCGDNQHISFDTIEIIHQDVNLHCITVQDHLFKVSSQDILVHNMEPVIASTLIFGFIQIWEPVLIILGSTVSLRYTSIYSPFQEINGLITYEPSQEKLSFDYKYTTLERVKKELVGIHNILKAINYKFDDQKTLLYFTPAKQNNLPSLSNITAQSEGELDAEARLALTKYRQEILQTLQEDICNLQIKIGLCINESLYRYNETIKLAAEHRKKATDAFYFNGILNYSCSYDIAKKYYEHYMIRDMIIVEVEDRIKEIETIIKIFEKYNESSVIAKTSNILSQLIVTKKSIETSKNNIAITKKNDAKQKTALQDFFRNHLQPLPNVSKEVTDIKAKLRKNFKDTMPSRCKDKKYDKIIELDKKPNNDDAPRRYEKSQKHPDYKTIEDVEKFFAKGISPSPQNGQAMLDSSILLSKGVRGTIQNGYVVFFYRTRCLPEGGSIYHGFLESMDLFKRRDDYREIFIKNNIINRSGKIL